MSAWSIGTDQGAQRQEPEPPEAIEQMPRRITFGMALPQEADRPEGAMATAETPAPPAEALPATVTGGSGGAGGGDGGTGGGGGGGEETLSNAFSKLAKWIPGDVLALYVTAVTVFGGTSGSEPSVILLIVSVLGAGLFVLLAAFAKTGAFAKEDLRVAGITAGAFVIWSVTVPFAGWQQITWVHNHQGTVAFCAAVVAIFYCFFAEGMAIRLAKKVKSTG
jgi:hypothetical protein